MGSQESTSVSSVHCGISAHASRKDIERGLKLGMDDFKPKPIVLKTLTGLHESPRLAAVRAKLDNVMNLPSLEVKKSLSPEIFTIPAAPRGNNGDKSPLFAIPGPKDVVNESRADDKSAPLFAVPRRPSQLGNCNPPLFSIPPELTDAGRRSPKGKASPVRCSLFHLRRKLRNLLLCSQSER